MKPVLRSYSNAVKPQSFYTQPKIMGHVHDTTLYTKTCVYKSPALKASFVKLKQHAQYTDTSNYNSSLFYVIQGEGKLNDADFAKGDVLCTNSTVEIKTTDDTVLYNVDDGPLMEYYTVRQEFEEQYTMKYSHDVIMTSIQNIEQHEKNPNRLGVIFGTNASNTIGNTLWCLMTKTLPGVVQPPHKHNSVALDYCICGKGYTLFSKTIDKHGNLINPMRINWDAGMMFVTPPGWWHSHHSNDSEPSYLFPVQDAGLHMYLDTLNIEFSQNTTQKPKLTTGF